MISVDECQYKHLWRLLSKPVMLEAFGCLVVAVWPALTFKNVALSSNTNRDHWPEVKRRSGNCGSRRTPDPILWGKIDRNTLLFPMQCSQLDLEKDINETYRWCCTLTLVANMAATWKSARCTASLYVSFLILGWQTMSSSKVRRSLMRCGVRSDGKVGVV